MELYGSFPVEAFVFFDSRNELQELYGFSDASIHAYAAIVYTFELLNQMEHL